MILLIVSWRIQVVNDISSKLDLSGSVETVESIDANHMSMARCGDRQDVRYRAISGVLNQFIRTGLVPEEGATSEQILQVKSDLQGPHGGIANIPSGLDSGERL